MGVGAGVRREIGRGWGWGEGEIVQGEGEDGAGMDDGEMGLAVEGEMGRAGAEGGVIWGGGERKG